MGIFNFNKNGEEALYVVEQDGKVFKMTGSDSTKPVVNDKKQSFKVFEEDGFTYIQTGKKKVPIEIIEKHQNQYEIMVDGVSYNYTIESSFSFERKKLIEQQEGEAKTMQILSPMPGKIVEVLTEEGAHVKEGDPLLILEAMKMQNEVLANRSGKIIKVNVKKEQSVMKDELLVEIEKE